MFSQRLRLSIGTEINISQPELVAACALGLLLGIAAVAFSPVIVLGLVLGIILLIAAIKRPELALIGILVATSTIIYVEALPLIRIGIGSLSIADVFLLALLGLIVIRKLVEPDFKIVRTPLDLPLLAFYGFSLLSTFVAIYNASLEFNVAMKEVRKMSYYLTCFIVTNLVRDRRQCRLLVQGLGLLASLVAGAMVIQYLVGTSIVLLPGRVEMLQTDITTYDGVSRILPPGQSLVLVVLIEITCLLVLDSLKPFSLFRFLLCSLTGVAVLLTFNRTFWVMTALAIFILVVIIPKHDRRRFAVWGLILLLLCTFILLPTASDPGSPIPQLVFASLDRLGTLVTANALHENSLRLRYLEDAYALRRLWPPSLLGLGLGAQYRPLTEIDWANFDGRAYIHNGHLWILLKSGWLGYLAMLWMWLHATWRGFRYWNRLPDNFMRSTVLAFTLVCLGVFVGSITIPMFTQWFWIPAIGIMFGTNEALFRFAGVGQGRIGR